MLMGSHSGTTPFWMHFYTSHSPFVFIYLSGLVRTFRDAALSGIDARSVIYGGQ